ncbi:MAG: N-acetyltransferase family protein [Bacteroidota bacterium]
MSFSIRSSKPSDVAAMMQLIHELAVFEKAPHEVVATEQTLLDHGFQANPLFVSWVAEQHGTIVGMALCYIRYSTWKGPVLYLEDLIVTETFRGNGIGKALFEVCIQHARAKQYRKMVWQVLDWNTPAIDFYKGYGANMDPEWLNASIDF